MRVLVDRLWPRGLRKADAAVDRWMKDIAPSTELRQWFGHDPERWLEFRCRDVRGTAAARGGRRRALRELARHHTVTLVFSARDETAVPCPLHCATLPPAGDRVKMPRQ